MTTFPCSSNRAEDKNFLNPGDIWVQRKTAIQHTEGCHHIRFNDTFPFVLYTEMFGTAKCRLSFG